jgi:NAD+ synthetase
MPSKITSNESKTDAQQLAQNLGMNFATLPIKDIVDSANTSLQGLFSDIETKWSGRYKESYTMDNIQARSRAVILWGVSNEFGSCLPIATSDKSEAYMGYATINGDMSGGFAPIADITKTKLFALARWLNKNREVKNAIPESIIQKRPGAELAIDPNTGKPLCAEDALMPYEFMDEVIWRIENKKESYNDMLNSEFLYERTHKTTKEQKIQWLDKFYKRMNSALYKASIMPPFVYVDSKPIGKQPITASAINYKGYSEEEIKKILGKI